MDALSVIAAEALDNESDVPLYQQLEQRILQLIATGALDGDTALPPEMQLCETFGLSRATVRRAYGDLVEEGRVIRHRGQGTFVSAPAAHHMGEIFNFSQRMAHEGLTPSSRVLEFRTHRAPARVAAALGIDAREPMHEIRRLRLADGRPMTIETSYTPKNLCPDLTRADLERSLFAYIAERSHVLPSRADETFDAVGLTKSEANLLESTPGTAAFQITTITYDTHDEPFELSVTLAPGDRNRYRYTVSSSQRGPGLHVLSK